jgi:HAD superfamily hydrolase (TIGR01509 family)
MTNATTPGLLFDLDGVLIDSEGLYTKFWEETERIYPTGIADFAHFIKGSNLTKILSYFSAEEQPKVEQRIHEFDDGLVYPLFPGAVELLKELRRRNIPAALVTSSDAEKMQNLFKLYPDFEGYFTAIINGSHVTHSKPHPEGYLLGAKAIGRSPEECIVIEDSRQGIQAGKAAGAYVVGLSTTLDAAEISPLADEVLPNIAAVDLDQILNHAQR